jgi:general secretion pathway protein K
MTPARREAGFALVMVLWTTMIVALIAASVMTMARSDATMSHVRRRAAEQAALADAGIDLAILRLLDLDAARRPPMGATPFDVWFDGLRMTARVQDESGKVDLNAAPGPLLLRLLMSAGLDEATAQTETDRILDWREPGDLCRLNGAKREDYRDAGLPYGPRLGPFPAVAELKLVLGITPDLFARLAPAITVYSQQSGIDQSVAPREALLALPGLDEAAVDAILLARHPADADTAEPGGPAARQDLSGHAFTVSATVTQAGSSVTRTAVIRLSGSMQRPIWIYRWE